MSICLWKIPQIFYGSPPFLRIARLILTEYNRKDLGRNVLTPKSWTNNY